jgi:hypothetical protein
MAKIGDLAYPAYTRLKMVNLGGMATSCLGGGVRG